MFDLNQLTGLESAQLEGLKAYIADLEGQRDAARKESIDGRKALKSKNAELESAQQTLFERLGISSLEELASLPDAKGQADAIKQHETRVKRLEAQLAERDKAFNDLSSTYRNTRQQAAMAEAIGKHEFIDKELVASYIGQRLQWEEDELLYRSDEGGLIPLQDGVSQVAKQRPHLLTQPGARGSGYSPATGTGHAAENPWGKGSTNITKQIELTRDNPTLAAQLKAAAAT